MLMLIIYKMINYCKKIINLIKINNKLKKKYNIKIQYNLLILLKKLIYLNFLNLGERLNNKIILYLEKIHK